jgi:hypothetical protein
MYFYCVENQQLISVLNYRPNTPLSVAVIEISDTDHARICAKELIFDVDRLEPVLMPQEVADLDLISNQNQQHLDFLNHTDWKILRHIRQQALGASTTLSQDDYLALEKQRESAAASIQKI